MHTRMTVLKDLNESDDDINNTIYNYWESDNVNLSEIYDIDYYTEVNIEQGIDILIHNFGHSGCGFKYNKNTQEVTITLKGIVKYFYSIIREINTFMTDNKPVNNFIDKLYSLQLTISPEHPKVLTSYCGLCDMVDFAKAMYYKMLRDKVDRIVFKVYKCYDYHF